MAEAAVGRALEILQELSVEELQQVRTAVEERLQQEDETTAQEAFHRALLAAGLVKKVKAAPHRVHGEPPLVPIQGKPLSETIIEERR
jgi:hypothetical protein